METIFPCYDFVSPSVELNFIILECLIQYGVTFKLNDIRYIFEVFKKNQNM